MILANERGIKQGFNHIIVKLIKCNVNNEYDSSFAVKKAPECKKTEEDKREKTAFVLD